MPKPRPTIILNAVRTVPDDPLDEKAWDCLKKISPKYRTKKMLDPFFIFKKEVSFPAAIKMLANQFSGSLHPTKRFPKKRQLDRLFAEARKTGTRLLETEETSPKVETLEKRLAGLLVEGQNLKTGYVGTLTMAWLGLTGANLTVLWNLRECLYRYYSDEELR